MSFWDDLGKNITATSNKASNAVKEKAEYIKLSNAISAQRNREKELYQEIGKLYFEKNHEEPQQEFVELFSSVKEIKRDIKKLNNELAQYKKNITCPLCGQSISKDSTFCNKCGEKII